MSHLCRGCANSCSGPSCNPPIPPPPSPYFRCCGLLCNCKPTPVPPSTTFRGCGNTCVKGTGCKGCSRRFLNSRRLTLNRFIRGKTFVYARINNCKSCSSGF